MQKLIVIDEKIHENYSKYLKYLGYDVIKIPKNENLYDEISSHTDISLCRVKDKLFIEPNLYKSIEVPNGVCGSEIAGRKYPLDVKYNLCSIGNFVIHNFKYTDKKILDYINESKLEKINVSQGYTNCSIAVIDDNSCITSDINIAEELKKKGIDVLLISKENEEKIRLLKNDGSFSTMHGFIGGCIGKLEDKIILFGDSNNLVEKDKIIDFIAAKGYKFVDFVKHDIIDYGGMISYRKEGDKWIIY